LIKIVQNWHFTIGYGKPEAFWEEPMVKDVIGKLLLSAIFGLTVWIGFHPTVLGSTCAIGPVLILGVAAAVVFAVWQPDGYPFHKGQKGAGFASATLGVNLAISFVLFELGHLASTTLF
jgi:hypothetical protein